MKSLYNSIKNLIEESEMLLIQYSISNEELIVYKKWTDYFYATLITKNINETITEIAARGLEFKVRKIKNPVLRWIYEEFTIGKDNISYNAPYLRKHTESDYNKRYIFWTMQKLKGLKLNLSENLNASRNWY